MLSDLLLHKKRAPNGALFIYLIGNFLRVIARSLLKTHQSQLETPPSTAYIA